MNAIQLKNCSGPLQIRQIRRLTKKIERSPQANVKLTGLTSLVWFTAASVISLTIAGPNTIPIVFFTAVYHFIMGRAVIRHIFGYGMSKATDLTIVCRWIRSYWRWYILGLIALLFFYGAVWLGTLASLIGGWQAKKRLTNELQEEYMAGTRPIPFHWLKEDFDARKPRTDPGVFFGGLLLPSEEATTHFRITGGSGSGKTNLLRLFMQSTLPHVYMGSNNRALLFDPKTEFLPVLVGMGIPEEDVIILNPFDNRARAWNMAKDLTRDRDANALANILLPEKPSSGGNNEFFDKAARRILSGVTKFFMRSAPGAWTLRDLVLAAQHLEFTTVLLSQDKKLKRNLLVLGAGDTVGNVMGTIAAIIGDELETIAAYLDYHLSEGRKFALTDWLQGSYILLLGCDRESEATLQPLNQLLFTRASQMLLSPKNDSGGTSYLILDELPAMGKLGRIDQLAELGRSYGVSLTVAFQTYSKVEHIYGDKVANALIAQFDKAAYLRTKDKPTAQWASDQIGDMKILWKSQSTSQSQGQAPLSGSRTYGQGQQRDSNQVARVDDFMNMPKPDQVTQTGVHGWYRIDNHVYRHEISSSYLSQCMKPSQPLINAFVEAPDNAEDLRLWDEDDIYRLGIQQVLSQFDEEKLKDLPVEEWVNVSADTGITNILGNMEDFGEILEE